MASGVDTLAALYGGLLTALSPGNLLACLAGAFLGQLVGIVPGIGPVGGIALLLPMIYGQEPVAALIMLAGIYYGAMYGGTVTSVLMKIPGENSSVLTALEGYEMARAGRAGAALGIAAFGSFIAGNVGMLLLALFIVPLSAVAVGFGSVEYAALMCFALSAVSVLAAEAAVKGLISAVMGLALATVGLDSGTGALRFTFGIPELVEGIDFVVVAIGLFALPELCAIVERRGAGALLERHGYGRLRDLWPSVADWRRSAWPIARGSLIGFATGVLPGAGATIAAFLSYGAEKRLSRRPEAFGRGAIEGVAGPESANNGAVAGSLVPMLAFGIPGSATTAILLTGFTIVGIQPGPRLFVDHGPVAWALIASMLVGNLILLLLNVPLIGLSVQLLRLPANVMVATVVMVAAVGVFSLRTSLFDLWVLLLSGVVGYVMHKVRMPAAPLLLSLVLAPLFERNLRRSLELGGAPIFLERPVALALLALSLAIWLWPVVARLLARRAR
ncbi:MAG TPA: tripartite tricarboxylate transporter permease [Thermodesulfobacteriota bacterium]